MIGKNSLILAAAFALVAASATTALAQGPPDDTPDGPPDNPGTPPDTPTPTPPDGGGPPEEFPGPGDFPADPSQYFPDQGCEHTPDRPTSVPGWVVLPFDGCGDEESAATSAEWNPILP